VLHQKGEVLVQAYQEFFKDKDGTSECDKKCVNNRIKAALKPFAKDGKLSNIKVRQVTGGSDKAAPVENDNGGGPL